MNWIRRISKRIGLHPLVGMGMILADLMLFSGEVSTLGTSWVVSAIVGLFLAVPSVFIQRFAYGDRWIVAISKSFLVGVLTGIPTALPSLGTASLTGFGLVQWWTSEGESKE